MAKRMNVPVVIPGVDVETIEPEVTIVEPEIETQMPAVETIEPVIVERKENPIIFFPSEMKMPTHHAKREIMPCPNCRRLRMDDMNQATACRSMQGDVAFYHCRACRHRWKMPIRQTIVTGL